jgi:hypothetical protein
MFYRLKNLITILRHTVLFLIFIISWGLSQNESVPENDKFSYLKSIYSDSWAIIIGINKYEFVDPLHYAVNDANSVKELLVDEYGFKEDHIQLITDSDATKDNILQGFNDILLKAGEKDRVIVFYAGHGETYNLPNGGDMGYLIPVDGKVENLFLSSIPMSTIYQIANMSAAKHILYLVDACYGGLALSTRGLGKPKTPEYVKKMTREKGRQVITAGGKDEKVIEKPEWGHSAFTRNLLKGLKDGFADENNDGIITGEEIGLFVKNRVVVDADGAHTPQRGRIGSEEGEFVFISKTAYDQLPDDGQSAGSAQVEQVQSELAEIKQLLLLQAQQSQTAVPEPTKQEIKPKENKKSHLFRNTIISGILVGGGYAAYMYLAQEEGIPGPPAFPDSP